MSSITCNGPIQTSSRRRITRRSSAKNGRALASWFRRPNPASMTSCWSRPPRRPWGSPLHPGSLRLGLLLKALDLAGFEIGHADVVEAFEQAFLAVRVDVEFHYAAVGAADFLFLQVDAERRIGAALGVVEQLFQVFRRHLDRQHAVLEAVVVENVPERGRDHAGDAEIHQRPGRVLARGAAAEIVVGDQNLRLAIGRLVEHEIGILAAVVAIALLREQALAETGALDGLQVLLGDDHVGVDIDHLQWRRDAFQHGELLHRNSLRSQILRTSASVATDTPYPWRVNGASSRSGQARAATGARL